MHHAVPSPPAFTSFTTRAALLAAARLVAPLAGCGPTYVRGSQVEGLDDPANRGRGPGGANPGQQAVLRPIIHIITSTTCPSRDGTALGRANAKSQYVLGWQRQAESSELGDGGFSVRGTIAKAFGLDDATRLPDFAIALPHWVQDCFGTGT